MYRWDDAAAGSLRLVLVGLLNVNFQREPSHSAAVSVKSNRMRLSFRTNSVYKLEVK